MKSGKRTKTKKKTMTNNSIEIDTTIKGGLPISARADVYSCPHWEYPGRDYLEELEIFFLNGYPFKMELSEADENKVCEEIFEAFNEPKDA